MNNLPPNLAEEIQPGLTVIWWGRRAFYELTDDIGRAIFRLLVLASFAAWGAGLLEDPTRQMQFYLAMLLPLIIIVIKLLDKIDVWLREVYVVCRNDSATGDTRGRVYKFQGGGIRDFRTDDDPITVAWPNIELTEPPLYPLWGWLTGEQMVNITLISIQREYITGQRISPKLLKAVRQVQGTPSRAIIQSLPEGYQAIFALKALREAGELDPVFLKARLPLLVDSLLFGPGGGEQ